MAMTKEKLKDLYDMAHSLVEKAFAEGAVDMKRECKAEFNKFLNLWAIMRNAISEGNITEIFGTDDIDQAIMRYDPDYMLKLFEQYVEDQDKKKYGKWKKVEEDEWYGEQGECPNCGHVTIDLDTFCPHCGAKLGGEE